MKVDASKRLIPRETMLVVAKDILRHQREGTLEDRVGDLAEHLEGVIDAHCLLLQRALCPHCKGDVPLLYVERWGEWLHKGEVTCLASRAREIMGLDPETMHDIETYNAC